MDALRSAAARSDPLPLIPFPPRQDRKALRPSLRRNGGSLGRVPAMAGWGRCIFSKRSGISGLAARDMLTIGGWVAVLRQMSLHRQLFNFRSRPVADIVTCSRHGASTALACTQSSSPTIAEVD